MPTVEPIAVRIIYDEALRDALCRGLSIVGLKGETLYLDIPYDRDYLRQILDAMPGDVLELTHFVRDDSGAIEFDTDADAGRQAHLILDVRESLADAPETREDLRRELGLSPAESRRP